jgi:hypothetical protein
MGGACGSYWAICWLFYVPYKTFRHSGPRLYPLIKSVGHQTSFLFCPPTYDAHKNIRWCKTRLCVLRRYGFRRPYVHGQFGGFFCPPGTPGPSVHPRGNFYHTDFFPPLSCSVAAARASPPLATIQAAPRRSLLQRQRSQNLTSASADAIWGAHRPNYIHGQFGGIFVVPQVPPAPRCTPVVIFTKLTSCLSLAPCCACQPSFGHIQAAGAPAGASSRGVLPGPGDLVG